MIDTDTLNDAMHTIVTIINQIPDDEVARQAGYALYDLEMALLRDDDIANTLPSIIPPRVLKDVT